MKSHESEAIIHWEEGPWELDSNESLETTQDDKEPRSQDDVNETGQRDREKPGEQNVCATAMESMENVDPAEVLDLPEVVSNWMSCKTQDDIMREQQADPHISLVANWKNDLDKPPSKEDLESHSAEVRTMCGKWKQLEFEGGVLYRKWPSKTDPSVIFTQLVTPSTFQSEIFRLLHSVPSAGHFGQNRTIAAVRQRFYWPSAKDHLKRMVASCEPCQKAKGNPTRKQPLQSMLVGNPLDRISLDICGIFPETISGNNYILVITDYFTKYTQFVAMKGCTAMQCADALMEHFICHVGVPRVIHSDQGVQFESELFQELCRLLSVRKTRTTSYYPACDGQAERNLRSMQGMLKVLVNEDRTDWDTYLPYIGMAFRATVHESTGFSPNFLMFGRELPQVADLMYPLPARQESRFRCRSEYTLWLRRTIQSSYMQARGNLKKASIRQKRNYDLKCKEDYPLGDFVYRFVPPGGSKKLLKVWQGPFRVLEHCSDQNVRIQLTPDSRTIRVHVNNLKPHVGRCPVAWADVDLTPPAPAPEPRGSPTGTHASTQTSQQELRSTTSPEHEEPPEKEDSATQGSASDYEEGSGDEDSTKNENQGPPEALGSKTPALGRGKRRRKAPDKYGEW